MMRRAPRLLAALAVTAGASLRLEMLERAAAAADFIELEAASYDADAAAIVDAFLAPRIDWRVVAEPWGDDETRLALKRTAAATANGSFATWRRSGGARNGKAAATPRSRSAAIIRGGP